MDETLHNVKTIDLSKNNVALLEFNSPTITSDSIVFDISDNSLTSLKVVCVDLPLNVRFIVLVDKNPFDCDLSLHDLFVTSESFKHLYIVYGNATCNRPSSLKGRMLKTITRADLRCASLNYFSNCICFFNTFTNILLVDCSSLDAASAPNLLTDLITKLDTNIDETYLNLSNNSLKILPKIPKDFALNITILLASNNFIAQLTVDNLHRDISTLDVRNNSLQHLTNEVIAELRNIKEVWLSGNPWLCDCSNLEFFNAMKDYKEVRDYDELYCANLGKKISQLHPYEVCFNWPIVASCAIALAFSGVLTGVFYKYKKTIKIILYAHNMCLWFVSEEELDEDKTYDAFVCFASPDQHLVEEIILKLEAESDSFECLVGVRDWPAGEMFPELVSLKIA